MGTPDQRQHWAGPHHYLGRGPNEAGVQAALGRWGTSLANSQVQDISQAEWASGLAHLRAHMREINPDYQPPKAVMEGSMDELDMAVFDAALETLTKHAGSPRYLQQAHDALCKAGAKCAGIEEAVAAAKAELRAPADDAVAARLRHLRQIQLSTF